VRRRLGLISPYWLPSFGGGEQYEFRLASELTKLGWEVHVFCATEAGDNASNDCGFTVTRFTSRGSFRQVSWINLGPSFESSSIESLAQHYDFFDEAIKWSLKLNLKLVIIGNRLQHVGIIHARELYLQLKRAKVKVGLIHHDLSPSIENALCASYCRSAHSWKEIAVFFLRDLASLARTSSEIAFLARIGSPLIFRPDFVVTNSAWSGLFIDPLKSTQCHVLHPILDVSYLDTNSDEPLVDPADVLMVNPQGRKNPGAMSDLILDNELSLRFVVLKGGWGDAFTTFVPTVSQSSAFSEGRLSLIERVENISLVYRRVKSVFFPSFTEGYGMAAVEPMLFGTPVVSSDYPAIIEAVGDASRSFCPFRSTPSQRKAMVLQVIEDRQTWSRRSKARAAYLLDRQKTELSELSRLLDSHL